MNTVSNFIKEVTARLKGDEASVVAAKNERKASSALNSEIAMQSAVIVDRETSVEDAKSAYEDALYPTVLIIDNSSYVRNIKAKKEALENAEENLKALREWVTFLESIKKDKF